MFKKLNEKQDAWRKKVVPILGDITKLNLGISPEERELLKNNVHVIFHAAATVRFDDPLKEALITNTRGTREICHLANDMKKLEVELIHAFINTLFSYYSFYLCSGFRARVHRLQQHGQVQGGGDAVSGQSGLAEDDRDGRSDGRAGGTSYLGEVEVWLSQHVHLHQVAFGAMCVRPLQRESAHGHTEAIHR